MMWLNIVFKQMKAIEAYREREIRIPGILKLGSGDR
jgi:hypothetical protein